MKALVLAFGIVFLAEAQIGTPGGGYPLPGQSPYPGRTPYPGGTPYPGQTPYPGGGTRVPGTRGGKNTGNTKPADQPMPSFHGKLKQMDAKSLSLELDDYRVLEFKLTSKTKYFKSGAEVKSPQFSPGDILSVEGPADIEGYLTAANVYWEKPASAAPAEGKGDDGVVDTWKDKDKPAEPATVKSPPPAAADPQDPGPPKLRRGRPEPTPSTTATDRRRETPEPATVAVNRPPAPKPTSTAPPAAKTAPSTPPPPSPAGIDLPPLTATPPKPSTVAVNRPPLVSPSSTSNSPPAVSLPPPTVRQPETDSPQDAAFSLPATGEPPVDQSPLGAHQEDPLIRKASEAALNFTESLPNYVVQEMITRSQSEERPPNWHPLDVVSTEVVYENGQEQYRNIAVNGKPVNKKMEELGGTWSTGEFGTVLIDLFSPATAAEFQYRHDGRMAGITAKVYDFSVKRENSHWMVHMGGQSYQPAYTGTTWIDPKNGRVLRIEMQARSFPKEFPTDQVETSVDYQYVRLGGTQEFLLPVHAENLSCQPASGICSKNSIDFRNYHKYAGQSTVEFDQVK